jgi:hypothetical protein
MKIYICSVEYNYAGLSDPVKAFSKEEDAIKWCDEYKTGYCDYTTYTELEVE